MKNAINPAMLELREAITEAEQLTVAGKDMTKRDESRLNVLLAKIAALRSGAMASKETVRQEAAQRYLRDLFLGKLPEQRTDVPFQAGTQTISFTQGNLGGYSVPQEFHDELTLGMAAIDPVVNPDVPTWITSDGILRLRPITIPGWDLSTFKATRKNEANQQNPGTVPTAAKKQLGGAGSNTNSTGATYACTLDGSFEFEEDSFEIALKLAKKAFAVGLARGIGEVLTTGSGVNEPQGLLTGATAGGSSQNPSKLVAADFDTLFFSVDAAYRASEQCAWVMNDSTLKAARLAVDDNNRPLINVVNGGLYIYEKPVLVSPSMPSFAASHKTIAFGDLSHFIVYASKVRVARSLQAPGYVEKGKALYTALQRVDSAVFDPTNGAKPPITYLQMSS